MTRENINYLPTRRKKVFENSAARYEAYVKTFVVSAVGRQVFEDLMCNVLNPGEFTARIAANHGLTALYNGMQRQQAALRDCLIEPKQPAEVKEMEGIDDV